MQPATLVAKPSSPRVPLILLAGFALASLGAVCVAFAAEFLDPSLKTSEQVENELGIPVLFSVPRSGARTAAQLAAPNHSRPFVIEPETVPA